MNGDTDRASVWAAARNVLCVRLDSIGDVLMTTPAMRAIKESGAGRRLTLMTSPAGARVVPYAPEIDDVIVYDAPWLKATGPRVGSRSELEMAERLRNLQFDAAVIFTVYTQNPMPAAFLCFLADIPLRLAHCHENPYQLLTDWIPDPEPGRMLRHEVRRQLDLVQNVGYGTGNDRLSFQPPEAAASRVSGLLAELGITTGTAWALVHPGATAPSRRYPPRRFAEVSRRLVSDHGLQVVFTGTEPELPLIEEIRALMEAPSHSLVGRLDLGELAAAIAAAPLLIANNTGPAHIAAAVGCPVVDLYALTNPQHTPWRVPARVLSHDVPCKYCYKSVCPMGHHDCLRLVSPEQVVSAACDLLSQTTARSTPHVEIRCAFPN